MTCIAITRGGFGDVWVVETRTLAYLHPLIQYGDALLMGPEDLSDQYNRLEWFAISRLAGVTLQTSDLTALSGDSAREARLVQERTRDTIWRGLAAVSQPVPTDPATICDMVSQDRRTGTMAKKEKAPAEAEVKKDAAPKERAPAGPRGIPQDAIIRMLSDKAGKPYGVDNNPKRAGTAGHERFAKYVDGMTVGAAIEAGVWAADIKWDLDKGFIKVEGGTQKEAEKTDASADVGGGDEAAQAAAA